MEKIVPEDLRKKDFHAIGAEFREIYAMPAQAGHIVDWNTVDALHDHDVRSTVVPVHGRHINLRRTPGSFDVSWAVFAASRMRSSSSMIVFSYSSTTSTGRNLRPSDQ